MKGFQLVFSTLQSRKHPNGEPISQLKLIIVKYLDVLKKNFAKVRFFFCL